MNQQGRKAETMIYIIRHGQTQLNSAHALQGRSDHPLNENGIAQAEKAARALEALGIRFDRVFSSPLTRAVQTAQIIAPEVAPVIEPRLIEMDYGRYEGASLHRLPPEILTFFSDFVHNPAPESMEQLSSVVGRVGQFLEEIRALPGNTLISTHAIAMKGALEYLTPDSGGAYWSKNIGNCAVYAAGNTGGIYGIPQELDLRGTFSSGQMP